MPRPPPHPAVHLPVSETLVYLWPFRHETKCQGTGSGERRRRRFFGEEAAFSPSGFLRTQSNTPALGSVSLVLFLFFGRSRLRGNKLSCDGSSGLKYSECSPGSSSHAPASPRQCVGKWRAPWPGPGGRARGARGHDFTDAHPASLEPSWARARPLRPRPATGPHVINLTTGISPPIDVGKLRERPRKWRIKNNEVL